MNTYCNEIKSAPVSTMDGKVVYRIPAGAKCGNGDLGLVFDGDENGLVLHISKCDFWKFTPGAHSDGGIKSVGDICIDLGEIHDYNIRQYFDRGLLDCRFDETQLELFIAPENKIYFSIAVPEDIPLTDVTIRLPETCNSVNTVTENGCMTCYTRVFCEDNLKQPTAVSVCLRPTGIGSQADIGFPVDLNADEGMVRIRYCVAVVTNFDNENHAEEAIRMAEDFDYDRDKQRTAEQWQTFFAASGVTLEDKEIETFYNASLYHLAGCMGNKAFPPGLFGNFVTDDFFPWAGDYHMNYNYEAPYYCIFSSNHPELFDGYMAPLNAMRENAKKFASFFGCNGYALPVSFGPMALDLFSQPDCKEHGVLFLGQKSHAAYACTIALMHWYSTHDKEYAKENYLDFVFNTARFWEDYLVKKNGRYIIKNDAAHEIPYYRGKDFNELTHCFQIRTVNSTLSLGLVKMLFKGVLDLAKELGVHEEKYALWEDIITNLSDFPTFIKKGKRCFRYAKMGIRWRDSNTVGLQHIYPASQIGLDSGEKLLKIARNSYFMDDRRLDDNGSNSYLPAGARIGVDPAFLLEGIKQNIQQLGLPNKLFRHHGGGVEHLTTVPATINEMLLQGHEGIIRLFPCWDKNSAAKFENLRADGAFLVSSECKNGKIASAKIQSLQGRKCTVQDCGIKRIVTADNREIPFTKTADRITFDTKQGETYILI